MRVRLALLALSCGGGTLASDAAPPMDGGVTRDAGCNGSVGPPCPDGRCPERWTTAPAAWCRPPDAGFQRPIVLFVDCQGYDIATYQGIDTSESAYYRSSDGTLIGFRADTGNFGGGHTCLAGVPDEFSTANCLTRSEVTCP